VRILLRHPKIELVQVTSRRFEGKSLHRVHPNLRKQTGLKFSSPAKILDTDFVFLCTPHGKSFGFVQELSQTGVKLVNKAADFRLDSAEKFRKWYHCEHDAPEFIEEFVYGLPEIHRNKIRNARFVAGPGCLATATILGLYPLVKEKVVSIQNIVAEGKIGSSAGGNTPELSAHHPERSGVMRSYKPTGHRHTAEIEQELTIEEPAKIFFSATAIEAVRGILSTIHTFLDSEQGELEIWKTYNKHYKSEPFVRIVNEKNSLHGLPEPKILSGTNYCDIGFELDNESKRLVVLSALDNLMKGGAGQGIQCMNIMSGYSETSGLEFAGLHPL
jgi:LysW-gamma-L-alpha-aminoadipyl-6-phosphate/LysW-L-glutamyl-5-phosphate reductase